jgi:hypothetical protein
MHRNNGATGWVIAVPQVAMASLGTNNDKASALEGRKNLAGTDPL